MVSVTEPRRNVQEVVADSSAGDVGALQSRISQRGIARASAFRPALEMCSYSCL